MKKRILPLLLALCMVFALLPGSVFAAKSDTDIAYAIPGGNIYFDAATGTITGSDRRITEIDIPAEIDGVPVTSIGEYVFTDDSLKRVTIPSSVTSIHDSAFYICSGLKEISVAAENPIYSSYDGVLFNKDRTTLLYLPSSHSTEYIVPDGVTSIGERAFRHCSLKRVTISASVTNIHEDAFYACHNLEEISVAADNPTYSSDNGILFNKDKTTLLYCPAEYPSENANYQYIVPDGVTSIGRRAFRSGPRLTNIIIPSSVTDIADSAFAGCYHLRKISVAAENPIYSSYDGVLFNKDKTALLCFPSAHSCENVEDFIQGSVTRIDAYAFYNTGLKSMTIPESVTSIGDSAFTGCMDLVDVMILGNVTSIGDSTFAGCCCMQSVAIPSSVTSIGDGAFMNCESLSNVYYAGSETQWNAIAIGSLNSGLSRAKIHYNTVIIELIDPTTVFTDVTYDWKWDGIAYCYSVGLMNGVSDTEFDPDGTLTRAMLVTVLWRLAGEPAATQDCAFPDLGSPNDPAASWYLDAVAWAAEAGIVNGRPDGTFDPKGAITRQELATMLYRFAGVMKLDTSAKGDLSVFPDEDQVLAYAVDAMTWANGAGLVKGNSRDGVNYLDPWGNATRAQVATILMRFCENVAQ